MALFDVVDDTVLMSKSILAPMLADIGEIGVDKFGQQVCYISTRSPERTC
jgi:hypothetical protein